MLEVGGGPGGIDHGNGIAGGGRGQRLLQKVKGDGHT